MLGMATNGDADAHKAIKSLVDEVIKYAEAPAPGETKEGSDDEPRVCPDPEAKTESMSNVSRLYQWQITGLPPNTHMVLNGVDFDGCNHITTNMLEAKALYAQFLNQNGTGWKKFWEDTGWKAMLSKAELQNEAARLSNRLVEFHFAEETVANLVRTLFARAGLKNTIVIWTKPDYTLEKDSKK
jgi:hypothetical protein